MRTLFLGLAVSGLALGQGFGNLFDKAPPHIEEALRARIHHFFQAHVDGKFRLADQVVHEDSKDIFFGAEKRKYDGFKIVSISYSDKYTKATVVVEVQDYFVFVGAGRMKVHRPVSSMWKQEEGQWWWYVEPYDPEKGKASPFGVLKETDAGSGPSTVSEIEAGLKNAHQLVAQLQSSVKANKTEIELQSTVPSSDTIRFTNQFQGPVTLLLEAPDELGLQVTLDKTKLEPGESAVLTVSYKPRNTAWKPELSARVRVDPTSQIIPVRIVFALPPGQGPASPAPKP